MQRPGNSNYDHHSFYRAMSDRMVDTVLPSIFQLHCRTKEKPILAMAEMLSLPSSPLCPARLATLPRAAAPCRSVIIFIGPRWPLIRASRREYSSNWRGGADTTDYRSLARSQNQVQIRKNSVVSCRSAYNYMEFTAANCPIGGLAITAL